MIIHTPLRTGMSEEKIVSVFGMGHVGTVMAACMAATGYKVYCIEEDTEKRNLIANGFSPVTEPGLDQLVRENTKNRRLISTQDIGDAIDQSSTLFICVGTPAGPEGQPDLTSVEKVARQIGVELREQTQYRLIVLRSTVMPGTTDTLLTTILEEASGKTAGRDFDVCFFPEFLREGQSVSDFYSPPYLLFGSTQSRGIKRLKEMFSFIDVPVLGANSNAAEMLKFSSNSFHAVKVAFANEIGRVCDSFQVDAGEVMRLFCQDTKLNISAKYLLPGFAFGGPCLTKDLNALLSAARDSGVNIELLNAVMESNSSQVEDGFNRIARHQCQRIGLLGLAFKYGTNDLRDSPLLSLARKLQSSGYDLRIYDEHVAPDKLVGANARWAECELPSLKELLCDSVNDLLNHAELIVVGHSDYLSHPDVSYRIGDFKLEILQPPLPA